MYRTVLSREEDGPGFGARLTFPFRLILNLSLSGGDFSLLLGFLSAFIGIGKFRAPEGPDQPCRIKGTVNSPPLCQLVLDQHLFGLRTNLSVQGWRQRLYLGITIG